MIKRWLILAISLAAMPAAAASAAEDEKPQIGQYVDLQPVALPIVIHGQLVNYVFAYVRVNLSGGADVIHLRTKEPFFRDALVREAHRTPFVVPSDWQRIDEAKLKAVMVRDASAIAGEGAVMSVVVTSQAPQHRVSTPRPPPAG
jgi:hypothetical protein